MLGPDPEVIEVVRQWVAKAENDLATAAHTLKLGQACPTDTVCFHAQQCVEKYLKALLVFQQIDFPKTHHLGALLARIPTRLRPALTPAELDQLTDYTTVTRYPGDYAPISLGEARDAVRVARRVRREARRCLPKAASS